MAEAVPISGNATDFSASGMADLPCAHAQLEDGTPILISRWRLTTKEIEELSRTSHLFVTVMGTKPQPMMLSLTDPRTTPATGGGEEKE